MDTEAITNKVKAIITDIVDIDEIHLTNGARFGADLGIDDFLLKKIICEIDDAFDINLPDASVNLTTVGALIDLIASEKK